MVSLKDREKYDAIRNKMMENSQMNGESKIKTLYQKQQPHLNEEIDSLNTFTQEEKIYNIRAKKSLLEGTKNAEMVDKLFTQRRNWRVGQEIQLPYMADYSGKEVTKMESSLG